MPHGRDKPHKEKRKPKKDKTPAARAGRDVEVIQHIAQHPRPES